MAKTILFIFISFFTPLSTSLAQKLAYTQFNQLAKIEPILYDYSYNKKIKQVINNTNRQKLETEIHQEFNYISFEEWGADNSQTFIKIIALRNISKQPIYAVIKRSFSDIESEAVIRFWRLEKKEWRDVSKELLPRYDDLQVVDYQDCAGNLKREAKVFPVFFELENKDLVLRYKADVVAANGFCLYQREEDNTGGEIAICALLNCCDFYIIEWAFDPLVCKFERLK